MRGMGKEAQAAQVWGDPGERVKLAEAWGGERGGERSLREGVSRKIGAWAGPGPCLGDEGTMQGGCGGCRAAGLTVGNGEFGPWDGLPHLFAIS